jgi:hypothetical protein
MEKYEEARDKAARNVKIADHMLTQTYPLVNDPKILVSVIENIFLSLTNSMASLLYFEKACKNMPPFHDTFESKYNLFKMKLVDKHNIDKNYIKFIEDMRDIVVAHKKSPMEFSRNGSFVICSDTYNMKSLAPNNIKLFVSKAKSFNEEINKIIKEGESRNIIN